MRPNGWLLWVDGGGGVVVGALVLVLHGWIGPLYGLSEDVVLFLGVANLTYGA